VAGWEDGAHSLPAGADEIAGARHGQLYGIDDPRRTPLCISTIAMGPVLTIDASRHVVLQDLVLRGSVTTTLLIKNCADIALDGVTVYGGGAAMQVGRHGGAAAHALRLPRHVGAVVLSRCAEVSQRGGALFSATTWMPTGVDNRDFEIAYSEFTDSEDGVFLGAVRGVRFHHNLLENLNDDGIFVTVPTGYDGQVAGGDMKIWQNRLAGCLTTFSFGVGHGRQIALPDHVQTGDGIWITRTSSISAGRCSTTGRRARTIRSRRRSAGGLAGTMAARCGSRCGCITTRSSAGKCSGAISASRGSGRGWARGTRGRC